MENVSFTYHCTFCSASAVTQEKLNHHINEVHDNYKPFKCARCTLVFDNEDDVLKHIESCNEEQRCKSMKGSSSTQKDINCRDELLVQCLHCSWSFENRSLLIKHIKLRHCDPSKKEDGKVPCPLCDSVFPSKSKLGRHYNGVHLKLRPYECQECKIKFSQRATLNKHNKDVHSQSKENTDFSDNLSSIMHDSSDQESSEARDEQPIISTQPEMNLNASTGMSPSKLIVSPKLKLKLQSPSVPKEDKHNGVHKDLKITTPVNACSLCNKNFSQRSSLNRHLRCVHSLDTNKMKDKLRASSQQSSLLSPSNGSHRCFVCDVSFSRLVDLEDHNTDLHSDLVLTKGSIFADDRNDFSSQGSVSSSEIHANVPEAICTEEVSHEGNLIFSHPFAGETAKEPLFSQRQSETAIALRGRTDISSETATVAESLLSLPESVLPFSHPKDDVFNIKNDEDEPIGADLKQRINELSLALEHSDDTLALPSNSLASSSGKYHSASNLDESTLQYASPNKRYSSTESPESEPQRKKARRETMPPSKSDEYILPKMRSKRSSLPCNISEDCPPQTRSKLPRREISYNDNPADDFDRSKPDDFVEGTFRCMECYTFFYCKKEFECHMDEKHRDIRPFKCSKCHSSFKSEKALDIHDAAVHEKLKPHICPKCGTGFGQKASLYRHIKEVNHDLIYCSDCNACFNVKRDLAEHINSIHSLLKPFKCEHCERSFVSKHQRHIHHLTVHEKRRPYKCDQCGAAFGQRGSLHRHMKTVDHKFLPHKCPQCIRAFRKEEDLQSHISCDHSPSSQQNNQSSRMRPYKCSTCKTSFKHEKMLHDHIQSCHSTDSEIHFPCNVCNQNFDTEELMNAHIISHHSSTSSSHQCIMCKSVFKRKKQLKKHIEYVEQNSDSLRCLKCKNLFCLTEQLVKHSREMHPEPRPSIKEERSDLDNTLPCSSLFESLDYASAQSVKQNLELLVDNIKKNSPKKVVQERIEPMNLDCNPIPVTLENIRSEGQLMNNHFSPMIKQEYSEQPPTPSNNNTYEKYLEETPSISQYSNSNSPGLESCSSEGVKFNTKARFDHPLDKQYPRTVQSDVQYTVGVNPISYGDAPMHRDNYEAVHYSKGYINHPTNKPVATTNKNFQESSFIGSSNQCNDNIGYIHPKQKALASPYKNFDQIAVQPQHQVPFERKHYDRSQFILPTTEGTILPNEVIESEKSNMHFTQTVVTTMTPNIHNNGGISLNKSFMTENPRGSIVHHSEFVDALQNNKPIDASNKTFLTTSEYIDNVDNPMKFIEMTKDEVKNFVVTDDGEYIHSDQLKYVSPIELSNKNYHHINEMNQESSKYVHTIQKPLDITSKSYVTAADYQVNQSMKYVDVTASNSAIPVSEVDETIKYIEKGNDEAVNKAYNEYSFEPQSLNEAVKFVDTSKVNDDKSLIDKSEYYVPVSMGQIQYLVKDSQFGGESLTAYAVHVDDLKEQSKLNPMETLYAVALDDVKELEAQESNERVVNGVNMPQQYVIIDDNRGDKPPDGNKGAIVPAEPGGAKNYALTVHLVEAMEKQLNKTVGDIPQKQLPVSMDHLKMYVSQNYPQLAAAGPSMENESVPKNKVIFDNNIQYVNEVNSNQNLGIVKEMDVNNTVMMKDQQLTKTKLNQDNVVTVRDSGSEHFYVESYMCFDCNVLFASKELLKDHCDTTHPN